MSVQVRIPPILREATGGARMVDGTGPTVGALLANLDERHPGFRERLFAEDGNLRRFVNIYVNDEDIRYLAQLETPVADGDTVSILPAVAGGARRWSQRARSVER
jgi:molybdopterin synthase sulfur carrier subunit